MKKMLIPIMGILFLCSCETHRKQSPVQPPQQPETPKALTEKSSSGEFLSKRIPDGLVDALYAELVSNSPELRDVDDKLKAIKEMSGDSLSAFQLFTRKNEDYYRRAFAKAGDIQDSVLKKQMLAIIARSDTNYKQFIEPMQNLESRIDNKNASLQDYHIVLKLKKTLPVIQQYQQKSLPPKSALNNVLAEQDKLLNKMNTMSN